ncbi:hypothetical protein Tsubulata_023542 [Turnera subulata]|uniref:Leucine-rich repeat-containing N-terminal plant-type domain-containing protein n=1 Tax=Turnera subulata TaxID=218843 RepID=A0A9Q0F2B3_9ROSI|nr:hypothetical protein Tsubulata_023542 [Turnera subulata]
MEGTACPCRLISLLFLHLQAIPLLYSLASPSPLCPPNQSNALLRFKTMFSINKAASYQSCDKYGGVTSFPKTLSWKKDSDCCFWDGVTCDNTTGNVIGLDLSCSWLYGTILPNTSLPDLHHLQRLNLAGNDFRGSRISSEFGRHASLTELGLSTSVFSGPIPSEISQLSKLVSLDFSNNDLLRVDSYTFEILAQNLTALEVLTFDEVIMSSVLTKSLLNLSCSLVSLRLSETLLAGEFPVGIFLLPYLQELSLSSNRDLKGHIPNLNRSIPLRLLDLHETGFSGELPHSIGNLRSLTTLILDGCHFSGPIPASLWNLTEVAFMNLRSNEFRGELPSSPLNLDKITYLDLSFNHFNGLIPETFANLRKLTHLYLQNNKFSDLSHNQLDGKIPEFQSLSPLSYLDLSDNRLTGHIPEFHRESLRYINLRGNMLHGTVPRSLFKLENLSFLDLSSNNLVGTLELDKFSIFRNLWELSLSDNNLSIIPSGSVSSSWPQLISLSLSDCNLTEFPPFLRSQVGLIFLDLSKNNLHGEVPRWMSYVGHETLWLLDLSYNFLTQMGQLPWKSLTILNLGYNMLQGPVPIPPPGTGFFSVSNNNLSGGISSLMDNCRALRILVLSHNNLRGMLPDSIGNFSRNLRVLDLKKNDFQGTVSATFPKGCRLKGLILHGNQLVGPLPPSISHCKDLEVLDFGNNKFKDVFPYWLEALPKLQVLVLRSNKLHGSLPYSPGLIKRDSFRQLQLLDLSNNHFVGHLPVRYIENLKAMMIAKEGKKAATYLLETSLYFYSVTITLKGLEVEMQRILDVFVSIDLSSNKFEGEIPKEIGDLRSLKGLNFSHNNFSGAIPTSIGNLSLLEWFDLSANQLGGGIPEQLVGLTFLAFLNLSQNQLVGSIPRGAQFDTFTNDSYKGNLGLCGFPLSKTCADDLQQPREQNHSESESGFGWKVALIGYGCGVVFGVALGCVMFQTGELEWLFGDPFWQAGFFKRIIVAA